MMSDFCTCDEYHTVMGQLKSAFLFKPTHETLLHSTCLTSIMSVNIQAAQLSGSARYMYLVRVYDLDIYTMYFLHPS